VREQWTALRRKLLGHFGYFGITGNYPALHNFWRRVIDVWRVWLSRRSQRAWISIERMQMLLEHYPLPTPRLRTFPVTSRSREPKSRMREIRTSGSLGASEVISEATRPPFG
jgi:hypothetical protein